MFCPRCGTLAASGADTCGRCGASLTRPELGAPEPPAVRAPTNRGEEAQRAAGVVARSLPKAPPRSRPVPPPVPAAPPAWGPGPAPAPGQPYPGPPAHHGPAPAPAGAWPPPPAQWQETAPGRWAPPDPQAPPPGPARPAPQGGWPPPGSPGPATPAPDQPPPARPPAYGWPPSGPQQAGPYPSPPAWGPPPGQPWPPPAGPPPGPEPTSQYPQWGRQQPSQWPPRPRSGWSRPAGSWWDRVLGAPAPADAYTGSTPPTYFWQALVCLFLFLPTGAAAVIYSLLVTRRAQTGDGDGSVRASRMARLWCLATLLMFAVAVLVTAATGWQA